MAMTATEAYGPVATEACNDIGVFGLGVMGRNLALNMTDKGFAVAAYNRTDSVTRDFASRLTSTQRVQPCFSPEEFVASLARPRKIMIMVKAGRAIDAVIDELKRILEPGDVLIDGGNSHHEDTERREKSLAVKGISFLGIGISGGEFGARTGPSIMPGGDREAYESVRRIFEAIAARVDGRPCVAYLGRGAAGHYTKMVHNGIEYGVMQLIADTYSLMKLVLGLSNDELATTYGDWNEGELESYLVEITSNIFKRRDEKTGSHLIDVVRGEAGQLGTGMWSSQSAMELRAPTPNVDVAVAMRNLSNLEEERRLATMLLRTGGEPQACRLDVEDVRDALYASMLATYAQGFCQLRIASVALDFGFRLEDIAFVWSGGCIIRSRLLTQIQSAFRRKPEMPNVLLDSRISKVIVERRGSLARAVRAGISSGVAVPGLMAALSYLDSYRSKWHPTNLIQAQRDYFGAHTYRRIDEDGIFHTDWLAG